MKKALIVGINDYPNAPLKGCVNDAISIANILETHGDGSPNFAVRILTSPDDIITKAELKKSIKELFTGDCDTALFYFSGHGAVESTGGYIVTTDYEEHNEGINMDEVLKIANDSNIKDKIIILDCCYSGIFGNPSTSSNEYSQLKEGITVLTASRKDEPSYEIDGSGIFSLLLIEALKGGSADLRGEISPGSLYSYVDRALGAWDQRPIFKTNVSRFISLRNINPPIPLETLRKISLYFPIPQYEFALDPSYEFTYSEKDDKNVLVFKDLQKFERVGLVVPVGEEYMYFAAMNSKSCKLTALGYHYWRLAKEKKI